MACVRIVNKSGWRKPSSVVPSWDLNSAVGQFLRAAGTVEMPRANNLLTGRSNVCFFSFSRNGF